MIFIFTVEEIHEYFIDVLCLVFFSFVQMRQSTKKLQIKSLQNCRGVHKSFITETLCSNVKFYTIQLECCCFTPIFFLCCS